MRQEEIQQMDSKCKTNRTLVQKRLLPGAVAVLLLGISAYLLKRDVWTFWTWWLMAGLMGFCAMPVTGRLFAGFEDKGWIFSKVFSVGVSGFLTWFLVSIRLVPFTTAACVTVVLLLAALCVLLLWRQTKKGVECFPAGHGTLVFWEEVIFFAFFLLWTYLAGFHPQAYGTEKFMDYGFMEAMMRSTTLPARDLWYSEGHINYYYGGQYFAVFLTKLSMTKVELTYNLMRTFVAGLAFAMPFSLVYQLSKGKLKGRFAGKRKCIPALAGLTAGLSVSIAGNMHYVVYAVVLPWIQKLRGVEVTEGYWFPDATRYIGYNPDVADKTIHEFPCYSFVLGDLHAHVVNIMFVLLVTGILYAWMKQAKKSGTCTGDLGSVSFWKKQLLIPHILLVSLFLGMFQWTNFWDFVIYFVVAGGVVLFANIIRFEGRVRTVLAVTAAQAIEVLVLSYLVILPFTLQFATMVDGVALAQNHTRFYQLLVLWGLPAALVLLLLLAILWEKLRGMEKKSLHGLMASVETPDLFAVIMGLCAFGLVLIPELVYVRDIYENGHARANTMFKLTYQAYILFGMTMGYGIFRLLAATRQRIFRVFSALLLVLLLWTVGYFGISVKSWFGEVWKPEGYQGLNATTYLETDFSQDASAVRWLKKNIKGSPVVLEANGDSYTGFERVSASTGLPTVLGWYVHEWLWRGNVEDLNQKSADIESIYTSADDTLVKKLLQDYEVSYIFIGSKEQEKYGDRLNHTLLQSLGTCVFSDQNTGTYIMKVD